MIDFGLSTIVVLACLVAVVAIASSNTARVVPLLLVLLTFNRFMRRLNDWAEGEYHPISLFSVLGLVSVTLVGVLAASRINRLPKKERKGINLIVAAIGYAFLLGLGRGFATFMALLSYSAPLAMYIAVRTSTTSELNTARIVKTLGLLGVVVSLYGFIQYAYVPEWDAFWMRHCGLSSIGYPIPFQIRVFSTMSDANIAGMFLAVSLLPMLVEAQWRPLGSLGIVVVLCGLGITLVRSSWVMVALGLGMWTAVSSGGQSSRRVATAIVMLVGLILVAPAIPGGKRVMDRLNTFGDLASDRSATGRVQIFQVTLLSAVSNPVGKGLAGTGGVAGKLGGGASVAIDNGLTDLLITFGLPGVVLGGRGLWLLFSPRLRGDKTSVTKMQIALGAAVFAGLGSLNIFRGDLGCIIAAMMALGWAKETAVARQVSRVFCRPASVSPPHSAHFIHV